MREKKFGKRCLTWVLVLMMTLSLLPVSALAADGEARFYRKNVTIMDDCDTDLTAAQNVENNDAVVYEGESEGKGKIIYASVSGNDENSGEAPDMPKTLSGAIVAADNGDTIMLAAGTYYNYNEETTKKSLNFVGAGQDKTIWNMGTSEQGRPGYEDGDYSLQNSDTITFTNMTLQSSVTPSGKIVSRDYTGFVRIDHIIVNDCAVKGRTTYWGYTDTEFHNTTFYAPGHSESGTTGMDYSLWTGTGVEYTFDHCTFYSVGKTINVYRDDGAGTQDITINFNDCTAYGKILFLNLDKPVLNVNDSNMGKFKYTLNISGNNLVNNFSCDKQSCSRLFGFGGKTASNTGRLDVYIEDELVWTKNPEEDKGMIIDHDVDFDTGSYDNGNNKGTANQYTEGYKDNYFKYSYSITGWDEAKQRLAYTSTKTCNYCKYSEESEGVLDITALKTATQLDTNSWTSDVTLSMTGEQVKLSYRENAYSIPAGSTVTDTIGEKFNLNLDSFKLTVGDDDLISTRNENTITFKHDKNDETDAYTVTYTPATRSFTWTANEPVVDEAKLTYTVTLANPQRGAGTYGVTDLNGDGYVDGTENEVIPANALYTNESAVLTVKYDENNHDFTFPKPSVSYTVKPSYRPPVPTVEIPDDDALGLNTDDHFAYIIGYPDGTVRPNGQITRAEATTIFFRLLTEESRSANLTKTNGYTDVAFDAWYNTAVSTMTKAGIVDGYPDGTFRPDAPITRAEMAKIISLFAKLDKSESRFSDIAGHWAEAYIKLAAGNGWIAGYPDGTFGPQRNITRAETATMINRVLDRVPSEESHLLSRGVMQIWPDANPGDWFYLAMQEATNSHDYERNAKWAAADEQWTALRETRDWKALEQ